MDFTDEIGISKDNEDLGGNLMSPPPRPALLGSLIDYQKELNSAYDEKFKGFLQMAWISQKHCEVCPISVTANTSSKTENEINASKDESKILKKNDDLINSSFTQLFEFYSKFSLENTGGTFSDINDAKTSLSHQEYETFLRNFDVIPKLISRDEMSRIWSDMSQAYIDSKRSKSIVRMDLRLAEEFLVRVSLYIFCAVGMRKATLAATGKVSTAQEIVLYLIAYMKLDNDAFIKDHIRDGRAALTQVISHKSVDSGNYVLAAKLAADDAKYKQYDSNDKKKKKKISTTSSPKIGINSKRSPLKKFNKMEPFEESSRYAKVPQAIHEMLNDPSNTHVIAEPKRSKKDDANGDSKDEEEVIEIPAPKASRDLNYNHYLEQYNDSLLSELHKYSAEKTVQPPVDAYNPSYGAFCDVGHVECGSYNTVRLFVHNRSPNDLKIDVIAIDFLDENTKVVMNNKELVSGLSRQIEVSFQAPLSQRSVLGRINLSMKSFGVKFADEVSVPVFYYTASEPLLGSNRDIPPLRTDNMRKYIEKYIAKDFIKSMENNDEQQSYTSSVDGSMQKSLSMSTVDASVSKPHENNAERSEAAKLGTSFVKTRNAWYGMKPVGGGGQAINTFSSQMSLAGSNPHLQNRAMTATGSSFTGSMRSANSSNPPIIGCHVHITDDMSHTSQLTSATGW